MAAANVKVLSEAENAAEIARMLGGKETADELSLEHARKLIEESRNRN